MRTSITKATMNGTEGNFIEIDNSGCVQFFRAEIRSAMDDPINSTEKVISALCDDLVELKDRVHQFKYHCHFLVSPTVREKSLNELFAAVEDKPKGGE